MTSRSTPFLVCLLGLSGYFVVTAGVGLTLCEGGTSSISCGTSEVIRIHSAVYGRSDLTTCPHRSTYSTSCASANSYDIVRGNCDGHRTCVLSATNGIYGDPCRGTYKYLNVQYSCRACDNYAVCNGASTLTVCERRSSAISCRGNKVIHVQSAVYGRSNSGTCPNRSIHTTNCAADNSLTIVRSQCNGYGSCTLSANNGVFGDPCRGTYKYLNVSYCCVDRPSCA